MASYDFSAPRLFVDQPLDAGVALPLDRSQRNYLANVLRLSEGDNVLIFNGRDGEWQAVLTDTGRRQMSVTVETPARPQSSAGDLHYLFAPLKHARLDYMVQKAVEMGASCLRPVRTRRTQTSRVNLDRMRANVIEAAEQCGILTVPSVQEVVPLASILEMWQLERTLVFCDEETDAVDPIVPLHEKTPGAPIAVLVGPEGGFDQDERAAILALPSTVRLSLGPRILRADTAAVAALTLVQAVLGDWRSC